jgi:hypothetical protein
MMKIKIFSAILLAGLGFALLSCNNSPEQPAQTMSLPNMHKVVVDEVQQGTTYTYLKVTENNSEYWVATAKAMFSPGETLYYEGGLEMKNFESKELNRTFDSLILVQEFSRQPGNVASSSTMPKEYDHSKGTTTEKQDVNVKPVEGGISIAELYANKDKYNGQTVKVSGKVTKVNTGIMGKNWIHIQDGTSDGDNYDLTITTEDIAQDGAIVTFEGKIALDKDFGAGYTYSVIMEDAKKLKGGSEM